MWWLDLYAAYPSSRVVLTVRDPDAWARRRTEHCRAGGCAETPPALLHPCGKPWPDKRGERRFYLRISDFSHHENVAIYRAYNELVECMVPPERLLVMVRRRSHAQCRRRTAFCTPSRNDTPNPSEWCPDGTLCWCWCAQNVFNTSGRQLWAQLGRFLGKPPPTTAFPGSKRL